METLVEDAPAKPVRATRQKQERQRTLSLGFSLNSNANFYDIPVVNRTSLPLFFYKKKGTHHSILE